MPLDAICLSALMQQLNGALTDARVDKVFQPEKDEIVLALRAVQGTVRLLISANANHARMHLTKNQKENPAAPPMFCMLLRKHLSGAKVLSVTQPELERMTQIKLDTIDEMGEHSVKILAAELMGRHSNIILVGADGRIIECLKRVDYDMSESRQVLPGLFYHMPPPQDKISPLSLSREEFLRRLQKAPHEKTVSDWLLDTFNGISPLICRELAFRAAGSTDVRIFELEQRQSELAQELEQLKSMMLNKDYHGCMLYDASYPVDFSYMPITQYGQRMHTERYDSFSVMLEDYYQIRDDAQRMKQRSQQMVKTVTNAIGRIRRKLESQKKELETSRNREKIREYGDLLMANLHAAAKGQKSVTVENFYDPDNREIKIPLDEKLSVQQNAAKYYKKYAKMKNAEKFIQEQLAIGADELSYLESVMEELERATGPGELEDIREELSEAGYLSAKKSRKKKKELFTPLRFVSGSGRAIYVGKNNRQNDILTMKAADKRDYWLHTQKIPGSHVIIDCSGGPPDEQTLTEAATLAALHSRASASTNVPVDYTQVKNVKKPPGAKPGMVIYDHYQTAFVTPDKALAEKLIPKE